MGRRPQRGSGLLASSFATRFSPIGGIFSAIEGRPPSIKGLSLAIAAPSSPIEPPAYFLRKSASSFAFASSAGDLPAPAAFAAGQLEVLAEVLLLLVLDALGLGLALQQPGFVRTVLDAGVPAVELVRIDAIDDLAAVVAAIAELRAGAVRVALDEVDGGAASLALLQAARFDALKLSGAVLRAAMAGARGRTLLAELLRLAAAVGARGIATHVETLPQLWAMQRAGVELAQGWLLGAPAAWAG